MTVILGVKLFNRTGASVKFQSIISKFGCNIGSRLGLPSRSQKCEEWGIILLEILDKGCLKELEGELLQIENIEIQRMVFK